MVDGKFNRNISILLSPFFTKKIIDNLVYKAQYKLRALWRISKYITL